MGDDVVVARVLVAVVGVVLFGCCFRGSGSLLFLVFMYFMLLSLVLLAMLLLQMLVLLLLP